MPSEVKRVHNFSAGPACLPLCVLEEAQEEMLCYKGSGMSFMEMSHRDANGPVQETISAATDLVREILRVPDNYDILFFHGGAHGQFAGIPMNLAYDSGKIDYVDSGAWSQKAMTEASKYADIHKCATFHNSVVPASEWSYRPDTAYIHLCLNETIQGVEVLDDPVLPADAPVIVADATSTLFSRPVDIKRYGVIYASAGKNFGPAGVCVVIVRHDLLSRQPHPCLPGILDLREAANSKPIPSIYNTPPCFQIYMTRKVLEHLKASGGVDAMQDRAISRSNRIYAAIDNSNGFYVNAVEPASRSRMNVCFAISDNLDRSRLEALFVAQSEAAGMFQLFKHPAYGGLRITLYNGIEDDAVDCVEKYLIEFAMVHGSSK